MTSKTHTLGSACRSVCASALVSLGLTMGAGLAAAPAALAEVPASAFGKMPAVYDAAISPDGTQVAIVINVEGTYGLRIVPLDAGADSKPAGGILLGDKVKPDWVTWANGDTVLLSVWQSHVDNGTPYRTGAIYRVDAETEEGDWLVRAPRMGATGSNIGGNRFYEQFYNHVVDMLPNDPDHILMTFMTSRQNKRDLNKVNVRTGKYETVERGSRDVQSWVTDRTGEARVKEGFQDRAKGLDDYYMSIKGTDGQWRDVAEYPGITALTSVKGFTSNPAEMIIADRQGKETLGLYVYDLDRKAVVRKLFHDDTYDVSGLVLNTDSTDVIGATFVGDVSETRLFDGYESSLQKMRAELEGMHVRYIDSNDDGDTLLVRVGTSYDPGSLILRRKGSNKLMRLLDYRPDLPSDEMGLVIPVRYAARDGARIPSYATLPPTVNDTAGIKNLPFIVLPHGGPFARDSAEFDYFAQFFASRGYGVLQMNFRGSTGYGESFAKAGREKWTVMREDVEDGARWLVEKGYADPDRMCVAGWSYGGYAALMSGVKNPELFSCVISVAGLSDLDMAIRNARDYRFGDVQVETIRKGFADKDEMRANSPVRVVDQMTLPTFIAHGTYDQQVQYDQHKTLRRALKKSDADVTEMVFKKEDHYMSDPENRTALMEGIDKFLRKVNGPSEFMKK